MCCCYRCARAPETERSVSWANGSSVRRGTASATVVANNAALQRSVGCWVAALGLARAVAYHDPESTTFGAPDSPRFPGKTAVPCRVFASRR